MSEVIIKEQSKPFQETVDSTEVLIRQVDTMISRDKSGTNTIGPTVPYSKLYSLASPSDKLLMYIGCVSSCVTGLGMPSMVFLIGEIIDSFDPYRTTPEDMIKTIEKISLIFFLIGVGIWIISYISYASFLQFSERVARKTRTRYLQAILRQESSWFDTSNPSELSARLGKEVLAIQKALGEKMSTIIVAFSMCVSGLTFAFTKGWSFSLVLLAVFPVVVITTSLMTKVMQAGFQENMKAYGQSAGYADQALNAIRVVVAYGQEVKEAQNYGKYLERARKAGVKTHLKGSLVIALFFASIFGIYAYAFYLGSVWIYHDIYNNIYEKTYTAGNILSCFFGVIFGMFSLGMAAPNIKAVTEGKVAGKMAFDIIDRQPAIDQDDKQGKVLDNLKGEIEFKNVTFYYPSRPDNKILKNFSMKFELGKTIALVGPSGSGKSTIVQLLERFYDPLEGQVTVDGVDLREINLREFRRKVGYVGQEPVLFNTTIKENIKLGCPDVTDEQIITALKEANAWEFIQKHDQGIDLHVGAAGGQISGGQKQRVAIARAFIKNPKILIFDEATSALDKKNEAEVQASIDNIRKELGEVTTVVIAHRLSTIRNADKIVVLKKGKIVEVGNHNTLLKTYPDGLYAKLVKQQQDADANQEEVETQQPKRKVTEDLDRLEQLTENSVSENRKAQIPHILSETKKNKKVHIDPLNGSPQEEHESFLHHGKNNQDDVEILDQPNFASKNEDAYLPAEPVMERSKSKRQVDKERVELANRMKEETDKEDQVEDDAEVQFKKQLDKQGFFKRLAPYNRPIFNVVVGLIASVIQGGIFPTFGIFITKMLFSLMIPDKSQLREKSDQWCLAMFLCCVLSFITGFVQKFSFGVIGENITLHIRQKLYGSILKKQMGWFDSRENAPGVLTSILASDVQILNGASTEGAAVLLESAFALIVGIALGFSFNWKLSLVALGVVPFMMLGGSINAKFQAGMSNIDEAAYKDANLLAGDAIVNYRTVASFGHDNLIINEYDKLISVPLKANLKKAHCIGFWFGFSQFIQYGVASLLYWAGAKFASTETSIESGQNVFIAIFAMFFGAFAAGQANQFGPDMGKAKKAGSIIFGFIEQQSKINAVDIDNEAIDINPETFRGEIEFKNVWFRYPTRRNEWVFKNLNLKLHPNESVAVVGESGSGKSTLVNLVLRFYEPNQGEVLIDGINIKRYNLKQLRAKMGLVMQEPTLFNYTIKENIIYGNPVAKDSEIREATSVANALEFIESQELFQAYEDSASVLYNAYLQHKDEIIDKIGEDKYLANIKQLQFFSKKEEVDGKFQTIKGEMDERPGDYKDITLHPGFETECGVKGGKLSGGQKQRVAIARAVVRKPTILILDEATSALDEESQRKVQMALENVMVGRTSIVIAHRLTTVEKCTRIVVIEDGQVVEEGRFNDLKNQEGGYFAQLAAGMKKAEKKEKSAITHSKL